MKDSRIQGFKDSSKMLKNCTCHGVADKRSRKELNVWQKSYKLCLHIYSEIKSGNWECRENAESSDQIPGKQTLGSLNPGALGPLLPANWEKKQIFKIY